MGVLTFCSWACKQDLLKFSHINCENCTRFDMLKDFITQTEIFLWQRFIILVFYAVCHRNDDNWFTSKSGPSLSLADLLRWKWKVLVPFKNCIFWYMWQTLKIKLTLSLTFPFNSIFECVHIVFLQYQTPKIWSYLVLNGFEGFWQSTFCTEILNKAARGAFQRT